MLLSEMSQKEEKASCSNAVKSNSLSFVSMLHPRPENSTAAFDLVKSLVRL